MPAQSEEEKLPAQSEQVMVVWGGGHGVECGGDKCDEWRRHKLLLPLPGGASYEPMSPRL